MWLLDVCSVSIVKLDFADVDNPTEYACVLAKRIAVVCLTVQVQKLFEKDSDFNR